MAARRPRQPGQPPHHRSPLPARHLTPAGTHRPPHGQGSTIPRRQVAHQKAHRASTHIYTHQHTDKMKYAGSFFHKATAGSAGYDLKATETVTIPPRQVRLVTLSATVALPHNTVGLLAPRSSLHKQGLTLANGTGIVDSDYRGTLMAALLNFTDQPVTVHDGDRIVQLVPVMRYTEPPQTPDKKAFRKLYLMYQGPKESLDDEWQHLITTYGADIDDAIPTLIQLYKETSRWITVNGMKTKVENLNNDTLWTSFRTWVANTIKQTQHQLTRKGGFGSTNEKQ
ncbi:MAG: hypothetical protein D6746_10820 [Bacteroidetes bacterium]|nr:MAG: hypothetical protein D6746_10820 [Bacteroidota bacterium]